MRDKSKVHILVTDSETGAVLISEDADIDQQVSNADAVGTHTGPGVVHGPVYHGVTAWVAPASRVHDWEPDELHVFVQYTDKSSSVAESHERVHTLERPLPGGGMGRFLVTAG
jgi:hypothetical protein